LENSSRGFKKAKERYTNDKKEQHTELGDRTGKRERLRQKGEISQKPPAAKGGEKKKIKRAYERGREFQKERQRKKRGRTDRKIIGDGEKEKFVKPIKGRSRKHQ